MVFFKKSFRLPKKAISFLLALMMIVPLVLVQTSATELDINENSEQPTTADDETQGQAPIGETDIDETGGQAADAEEEETEDPAESGEETDPIEGPIKDNEPENVVETGTYANSVSGILWLDIYDDIDNGIYAGDGTHQEGESPLTGYTVSLFKADDRSATVQEIATDEDGRYEFTNIDPGAYVVGVAATTIGGIEYLLPFYYLDGRSGDNRFVAAYDAEMDAYLYAYTDSIEVGGDTIVTDMDAGMRTLPGISPMFELIGTDGIIVYNESEFKTALANPAYTTIYLGANITMSTAPSNNNVSVAARSGTLVINGVDPNNPEDGKHTYTDYPSTNSYSSLYGSCNNISFKDIKVYINNYYGIYRSTGSSTAVTFDGVEGEASQFYYGEGSGSTLIIKDSALTLTKLYSSGQELVESTGTVRFEGDVTVRRDSSSSTGNEIFYLTGSGSTVKIADGADVLLDNSANTSDGDIFYGVTNFTVGQGAKFTCYSASGFCDIAAPLTNLTIGQNADVRFICTKSHTYSSLFGGSNSTFKMEAGSNFLLYDNENDAAYSVCYFTNIILVNPGSFIVLNPSARAMGETNRPILTATGVSSIRYYPSTQIASLFNTGTYAYTPIRNYTSWWAQSSPFHVTANTWSATSPTITNNTYDGSNVPPASATVMPSLASNDFSASSGVYGIEIYGTVYTVTYDRYGADSGTAPTSDAGVPNDLITVQDNTGNLARINYTFTNWNTAADGTGMRYSPGEAFRIMKNTTLYAQWTQNNFAVSGTLFGGSVDGLTVSYTIGGGSEQSVTTDSSGYYAITEVPQGSTVVITPPTQTGYTANPPRITRNGISADSPGNDFSYTLNKYAISGSVSGLTDNNSVTVDYAVDHGGTQSVTTDSGGGYTITDVPYGSTVVVTPPVQTGYTVNPPSITVDSIAADSMGNDFTYTRSFYTVTEKYVDRLTGMSFKGDTSATLTVPPYSYDGSPDDITAGGEIYVYQGYKVGSYSHGDTPDGTDAPAIGTLTADVTVYLIYHKVTGTISVTFPTGWDFYVNQDTYPNVETGTMGSSGGYYSFKNESDKPVYVDLTEVREISSGGLKLVADASLSAQDSSDYSLVLIPAPVELTGATNGFIDTIAGIMPGNIAMRLGVLDGRYVRQASPTSTNGYVTIGGYYGGYLSETEKNPQLMLTFTFSLISSISSISSIS